MCTIHECGGKLFGRGLCNAHYKRAWRAERAAAGRSESQVPRPCARCPQTILGTRDVCRDCWAVLNQAEREVWA